MVLPRRLAGPARRFATPIAVAVVSLLAAPVRSEVIDQAPGGFTLRSTATVARPPTEVWKALIDDVGKWWDPEHTYSGDSKNLRIDVEAGGCFCERLESGGSIEHAAVVLVQPRRTLRLVGGLGPLQEMGVHGASTWELATSENGTTITMTYAVGGYRPAGLAELAPLVDRVLSDQLARLARFVETGRPMLPDTAR